MRRAYALVKTLPDKAETVAETLRCRPGVKTADVVSGPYDVIALVEGGQAEDVAKVALSEITSIEGTKHVETCLVHRTEDELQDDLSIRGNCRCKNL